MGKDTDPQRRKKTREEAKPMARNLSPEQRQAKKEAQARWLAKKKAEKIDPPPTSNLPSVIEHEGMSPIPQETPLELISNPFPSLETLLQVSLCVSITSLLIYFQYTAYISSESLEPLSLAMSGVCEISLLYLSASLRQSFVACFLFVCLFAYNLGVMSFSVMRDEIKKTELETMEDPKEVMKRDIFKRAVSSFDLSLSKKETWNTNKILKIMTDVSKEVEVKEAKPMLELFKIEAIGLIVLRAILMLLNALLIHRILSVSRVTISPMESGK